MGGVEQVAALLPPRSSSYFLIFGIQMTCRNCGLPTHAGRCEVALRLEVERLRNQGSGICNQCVTKDEEIERLRNQLKIPVNPTGPRRDRAAYMREYRSRGKTERVCR